MEPLPAELRALISENGIIIADDWWGGLTHADRDRLARLWDERLEVCFFAPQHDEDGRLDAWEQVPAVTGGRFVPHDDDGRGEWLLDFFEYLLEHPELVLAYEPPLRTFHICTRHEATWACVAVGEVPVGFVCPVGEAACPMRRLRGSRLKRVNGCKP